MRDVFESAGFNRRAKRAQASPPLRARYTGYRGEERPLEGQKSRIFALPLPEKRLGNWRAEGTD